MILAFENAGVARAAAQNNKATITEGRGCVYHGVIASWRNERTCVDELWSLLKLFLANAEVEDNQKSGRQVSAL